MISDVNLSNAPASLVSMPLHVLLTYNESREGVYSLVHLTAPAGLETPTTFITRRMKRFTYWRANSQ